MVLAGGTVGQKHVMESSATIGRGSDATIQLDDAEISRVHARIEGDSTNGFVVEDLGSRNGTFLNDVDVERAALQFGDRLRLGGRVLLLFTKYDSVAEEILRRQRLEALGRLAAGIAHDFNNLLGAVLASLDYVRRFPEGRVREAHITESIDDAFMAAERASELTPRLLDFARAEHGHEVVTLSEICAEVGRLAERTFGRLVRIQCDIEPNLMVLGSSTQLHQIFMNLCLNARDAMPDGGKLSIFVARVREPGEQSQGREIAVTVRDTGAGIAPDVCDHIFEPFFTTKGDGAGIGLGLATVAEMVAAHGGRVEVESDRGKGSTFMVFLPDATGTKRRPETSVTAPPPAATESRRRDKVILVVDDERIVRRSLSRMLKLAGYVVMEAGDGEEAVTVYADESPPPDLVLLDLDMPKLCGEDTQRALRRINPNVRVLGISGHRDAARERVFRADGALGFLRKPWTGPGLLQAIANALHDARRTPDLETTASRPLPPELRNQVKQKKG
ncbi:MAG: response regulator [Deltaproteobacteria bacterium]|nr:response regulator [Deltaproteobacteria bacterium]